MIDPDGQIAGKVIKFGRNTIKHKGNPIKGAAETLSGIADDLGTLTDGQLNFADVQAVGSLITGFDAKDQKAIGKGAAKAASAAKRRASRAAQRKAGVSTSKPGRDTQGRGYKQPRHQIKDGGASNGGKAGIVDGSNDRNNGPGHPRTMEAGSIKSSGPETNGAGVPRIANNPPKGKEPF